MAFDLNQLFQTNKKAFIWAAFFSLLYLVRQLFGLVFITFILCFIFNNIVRFFDHRTRLPRRVILIVVYLLLVATVVGVLSEVMPRMATESKIFLRQFPESMDTLYSRLDEMARKHYYIAPVVMGIKETLSINTLMGVNRDALLAGVVKALNQITHYVTYFFLGALFSFFILFDLTNLAAKTRALRRTRFRAVYEETADSVVKFATVVGAAFQAQILIAAINTPLTAVGLWLLDIQPVALLSVIVFFAGLIPVLGIFISSAPILLLAFNIQGWALTMKAIGVILLVHAMETYVLNPRIFSAVLKINPILTLFILYIGHSLFGVWGVLLGAPVSVYVYRYIIMAESVDNDANATREECLKKLQAGPEGELGGK